MATLQSILFCLTTTTFFFGPTLRLNILSVSIPVFDISLILYTLASISHKQTKNKHFVIFTIWTIFSYLINLPLYVFGLKNVFYLIRLANFCLLFLYMPKPTLPQIKYLNLVIIANLLFGFIQYLFWPDLTLTTHLGWDPHLNRLTSTFLDPTFTGIIFLAFFIYIYFTKPKNIILAIIYICISLTYSRSTLFALMTASLFISTSKKNFHLVAKTIIIISLTVLILPNTVGEGTNLKRTSTIKAKIDNYKQAIQLISKRPMVGHGHNNLDKARHADPNNHASFGFDSSLLTITSTSGIIGLVLFFKAFWELFRHSNLPQKTLLVAIFSHSFFSNSLLYPWFYFILISYLPTLTKSRK